MRMFLAMVLFLILATSSTQAFKPSPVDNDIAAEHITECMLEGDADIKRQGKFITCCSKSAGFCVSCRESGAGKCTVSPAVKISRFSPVPDFIGGEEMTKPSTKTPNGLLPKVRAPSALRQFAN